MSVSLSQTGGAEDRDDDTQLAQDDMEDVNPVSELAGASPAEEQGEGMAEEQGSIQPEPPADSAEANEPGSQEPSQVSASEQEGPLQPNEPQLTSDMANGNDQPSDAKPLEASPQSDNVLSTDLTTEHNNTGASASAAGDPASKSDDVQRAMPEEAKPEKASDTEAATEPTGNQPTEYAPFATSNAEAPATQTASPTPSHSQPAPSLKPAKQEEYAAKPADPGTITDAFVDALKEADVMSLHSHHSGSQSPTRRSTKGGRDSPTRRSTMDPPSGRNSFMRSTYPPASHQRSQIGPQAESLKRTEPFPVIGRSPRFSHAVFLSAEHSKVLLPPHNPGPGSYNPKLLGDLKAPPPTTTSDGRPITYSSFHATEKRFAMQTRTLLEAGRKPGPGQYPGALNAPVSSRLDSHPVGFANAKRISKPSRGFELHFYGCESPGPIYNPSSPYVTWQKGSTIIGRPQKSEEEEEGDRLPPVHRFHPSLAEVNGVPGPGQYSPPPPDRVRGRKAGRHGFSFGAADRVKAGKASLTPGQAASLLAGSHSVGPAAYETKVDKLTHSRHAPSYPFGSVTRFPALVTVSPGPGSYCV